MIEAYRNALNKGISFLGPTNFEPSLRTMIDYVKSRKSRNEYNIMLFITDGDITDIKETIKAYIFLFNFYRTIEASFLPMSIIIIGVGNSDFSKMDVLDSDGALLQDNLENTAARDIVHFVRYNNYLGDMTYLHEDVLREIPTQFSSYMAMKGIFPSPMKHKDINTIY